MFRISSNGIEKILSDSHNIYIFIKEEILHIENSLDLLHDIQWFCAFSMIGDMYGGSNGFIVERIAW